MKYIIELTEEQIELMEDLTNLSIGSGDRYDKDNAEYALKIILEHL